MDYHGHPISTKILHPNASQNLLFLHGYTSNKNTRDKLWSHFSEYRIHAIDFPGHGGTKSHKDLLNLKSFGKIASHYLTTNKLTGTVVVGHSMGGGTAGFITSHRVREFILLCPVQPAVYEPELPLTQLFLPPDKVVLNAVRNKLAAVPHPNWRTNLRVIREFIAQQSNDSEFSEPLVRLAQAIMQESTLQQLMTNWKQTTAPVHIIGGADDPVITAPSLVIFKKWITNATLDIIRNCGHLPDREQPAELVRVMERYL